MEHKERPYDFDANTLYFDIEKTPSKGWAYESYDTRLFDIEEDWHIQSVAWAWGNGPIHVAALCDFPLYKKDPHNDYEVVKILYEQFKKAHIICGYNIRRFDMKMAKHRFIHHRFSPLGRLTIRDAYTMAKKYGYISNSLDNVSRENGLGGKIETGVKDLWKKCYDGDLKSWKLFKRYNKHDVYLTRANDRIFTSWEDNMPRFRVGNDFCKQCGSKPNEWKKNGVKYYEHYKKQRWACLRCGFANIYTSPERNE